MNPAWEVAIGLTWGRWEVTMLIERGEEDEAEGIAPAESQGSKS